MVAPKINETVRVVPAKRTASYDVPIRGGKGSKIVVKVNAKAIVIQGPSTATYSSTQSFTLPKTHEALDSLESILTRVHDELEEQGVRREGAPS